MLADIRADREEGGVEPPRRDFGQDVFNFVIEDDLHSGGLDPPNFAHEILSGQTVGGNAELHHAAGHGRSFVDFDGVAQAGEMIGGRQPARPGADHQHSPAARLRPRP